MRKLLIVLALSLLVAACATDNTEPPAPLVTFTPQVQVQEVWSASVGSGNSDELLGLVPAADGTRVYAAAADGVVSAWASKNGRRLWTHDTDVSIGGGPGAGQRIVAVGSTDGQVVALSAHDGHFLWRHEVKGTVLAAPAVDDGVVVVRTGDGKLIGLSGEDGHVLWRLARDVPRLSLRGNSTPVIHRGVVYAGFDDGSLLSVDLHSGQVRWAQYVSVVGGQNDLKQMRDIDGAPLIHFGFVYAVTYNGDLVAMTAGSGEPLWKVALSSTNGVGYGDRKLYVTDQHSVIHAINASSGSEVWTNDKMRARFLTRPTAFHGIIAAGDLDGDVHFLSQKNGKIVARVQASSSKITAAPIVVGDNLIVLSDSGDMVAYRLAPIANNE